jgi:hypothetical protein
LKGKVLRLLLEGGDAIAIEGSHARSIVVLCAHVGVVEDTCRLQVDSAYIVSKTQAVGIV